MTDNKTNTLIIRTPEGIQFPLLIASPLVRSIAWFIDWLAYTAIISLIAPALNLFNLVSEDLFMGVMILLYSFTSLAYPILAEWYWNGQTIGKRLFKLKVLDVQGLELRFSQIVVRNLLRAIDIMPGFYMAGGICAGISKKGQRIGDIAANTVVIRNEEINQPEFNNIETGKFNSFRTYPHLCNRLRHSIPPDLAHLALNALLRRKQLEPENRIRVYHEICTRIKQIICFPQEASDGLSDEQYLKNIVEIVFNHDH